MTVGKGYLTIAGVGAESPYGTEAVVTQQVKTLQWEINDVYQNLLDESLVGYNVHLPPDVGVLDITGPWRADLTYTLADLLLKHFMGDLASGLYSFQSDLVGDGLTWAINKQVSVAAAIGVKIPQMVFNLAPGGCSLSGTAIATAFTRASTTNTSAILAALPPNVDRRCKFAPDLRVRLGLASAALGSGDTLDGGTTRGGLTQGTVTMTRAMAQTHIAGQRGILEPDEDNFVDGQIALTLARYSTDQFKTWAASKTQLALELLFTKEGGGGTRQLVVPGLTITDAPNPVGGPGFVPQTIAATVNAHQVVYAAATISAAASDNSINDSAAGFPFLYPGAGLIVEGFTGTAANNAAYTVVSRTTTKIILSGGTLVNDAAGETVTIIGRDLPMFITET